MKNGGALEVKGQLEYIWRLKGEVTEVQMKSILYRYEVEDAMKTDLIRTLYIVFSCV